MKLFQVPLEITVMQSEHTRRRGKRRDGWDRRGTTRTIDGYVAQSMSRQKAECVVGMLAEPGAAAELHRDRVSGQRLR